MNGSPKVSREFWNGRRVLLTGHTGFKGAWLSIWLKRMGATVTGLALPPVTSPNLYEAANIENLMESSTMVDLGETKTLESLVRNAEPEIVLHLAAQSLVRESYLKPVATFQTNVMGSVHVLESLRGLSSVRVVVMVTTDKVYANREWAWPYREDDALGGHDPYSASKAASEIVIDGYRRSFLTAQGVHVASARAGNVIGGGDWSQDRLLPDAVRAWSQGMTLEVRRPNAVRPWQHVLEPLSGYLVLAQALWCGSAEASAYNFGPNPQAAASVREVTDLAAEAWGPVASIAYGFGDEGPHEAGLLALETSRSQRVLGIQPRWSLEESVRRATAWYRRYLAGETASALCHSDIDAFEQGLG